MATDVSQVAMGMPTTLGCVCETPSPRTPDSAICEACGLIYLSSEEYSAHLARRRAKVADLLARRPVPRTDPVEPVEAEEPEAPVDAAVPADDSASDEDRSRGWWRRKRQS